MTWLAPAPLSVTPKGTSSTWLATSVTVTPTVSAKPPMAETMISATPVVTAVTSPVPSTRATAGLVLVQASTGFGTMLLPWSRAVAVTWSWFPCAVTDQLPAVAATLPLRMPWRIVPPEPTANTAPYEVPQTLLRYRGVFRVLQVLPSYFTTF